MIEKLRTYIATCPYLDQYTAVNVEYLIDRVKAYSINESAGYNPIVSEDVVGNKNMQCLFSFDSKLYWNEEISNNIDNSVFFENFRNWLDENNKNNIFPQLDVGEYPVKISAITPGYIFATNADEAIYRIQCKLEYYKEEN